MPGNKKPTNPFLLLIAILLCLGSAAVFTQSSGHSSLIQGETVELAASGDIQDQDPAPGRFFSGYRYYFRNCCDTCGNRHFNTQSGTHSMGSISGGCQRSLDFQRQLLDVHG